MPRREVLKFRRCLSGGDGFAEELRGHPEPAAEAVAEDVKIVGAAYHRLPQSSRSLAAFDVGKGEAGRRLNRLDLGIFNLSVLRDEEVRRLGIVVDGTATVEAPKIGLIPNALDDDARALSHRVEKGGSEERRCGKRGGSKCESW